MTQEELMRAALEEMHKATITPSVWAGRIRDGYPEGSRYNYMSTHNYKAQDLLYKASRTPSGSTPAPIPASTFGDAGIFSGRGIMLGSNTDVWDQAYGLANNEYLEVVAVTPSMPQAEREKFAEKVRVVVWYPPELHGPRTGQIEQAESQTEWNAATSLHPSAICLNSWVYGAFPQNAIALVEAYYNEGWGVNFEVYKNYIPQGAKAVIPVCGGYSATGRTDVASAGWYDALANWSGGSFPGFWMYAGESLITPESLTVLKNWKPR